jgi:hypothetical protein
MSAAQNAIERILEVFPGIEQEAGLGLGEGGSQVPWCTIGLHILIVLLQVVPLTRWSNIQNSYIWINVSE